MFELVILFMTGLFVGIVAAMSPGPDSLVVLSAATTGGRLTGVRAACGIGLGLAVHASATFLMVFGFQGSMPVLLRVLQEAATCSIWASPFWPPHLRLPRLPIIQARCLDVS